MKENCQNCQYYSPVFGCQHENPNSNSHCCDAFLEYTRHFNRDYSHDFDFIRWDDDKNEDMLIPNFL